MKKLGIWVQNGTVWGYPDFRIRPAREMQDEERWHWEQCLLVLGKREKKMKKEEKRPEIKTET